MLLHETAYSKMRTTGSGPPKLGLKPLQTDSVCIGCKTALAYKSNNALQWEQASALQRPTA